MKRTAVAACLALTLSVARAQSTGRAVFTTVDAIRTEESSSYTYLRVTGVLEGAAAAAEERVRFATGVDLAECRRWALLAMTKPGQYRLSMRATFVSTATPPYWYGHDCLIERVSP